MSVFCFPSCGVRPHSLFGNHCSALTHTACRVNPDALLTHGAAKVGLHSHVLVCVYFNLNAAFDSSPLCLIRDLVLMMSSNNTACLPSITSTLSFDTRFDNYATHILTAVIDRILELTVMRSDPSSPILMTYSQRLGSSSSNKSNSLYHLMADTQLIKVPSAAT